MNQLEDGIYAAALTPMRLNLSCDVQELARHCLDLIHRGCQGVVLFGTTGEGASFSVEERVEVLGGVIREGVDPRKIILGNGSSNIPDSVELARAVLKWKCAAFLVAPPSFFKNVT
jgi:4-hydroxy-tetrahydrodipicolinate synthase